ncbi:MAG TPA: SPFH domain-containing protein [Victivallales bacterium]|nr:SPFH domain-containing protein [Victivallales bacterium]HPO89835.1 SPFH domain-containing protein [Victivallales bacterium]HRR28756.1 SPFH domain-containing protein [Victivallales bacterium]HRU00338.1 SPFH domain-containing protein [Victivallales bacterium]
MKKITYSLAFIISIMVVYFIWVWGFCRFYVPAGYMAIITSKEGAEMPAGQILAKKGQKGVWEEPLAEGRHFLNPIFYEWKIVPALRISAGKIGVVTSKVGTDLPAGEFLANEGQKGVWRKVLGPGIYRLNPVGYKIDIYDAKSIPIGYVGIITSLSGKEAKKGDFANKGEKGVMQDIIQPGLYYVNPYEYKVDVIEIGLNQVSILGKEGGKVVTKAQIATQNQALQELQSNVLAEQAERRADYIESEAKQSGSSSLLGLGLSKAYSSAPSDRKKRAQQKDKAPAMAPQKPSVDFLQDGVIRTLGLTQFVEFPSRDGFDIRLDMTVEFEFTPSKIASIFMNYGDLPAVVDKIIMPQILSISRLKGSSYKAQDFIIGEGREKFQDELREALSNVLGAKNIVVHNSLIRYVDVPNQILDPIQQRSVAQEQNLTNIEKQKTAKKRAELNTEEAMIEQKRQEVAQETEKIAAEIAANKEKIVAEIHANTEKSVAEIEKMTAEINATITKNLGKAKADIVKMVEGEKANGYQMKVKAVKDPSAYAWITFAENMNPELNIKILHAGDGTLWTDIDKDNFGDIGGAAILKNQKKK